jgi:UPF0755 protein
VRKLFSIVLLAVIALAGWLAWALWLPVTPGAQKFVMLRPGYSTRHIARELKTAGVIRSEDAFVLWHELHRRPTLKAGEYLFERDASAIDVHSRLARGDVYVHAVVIPEGFNMFDIAKAIEDAGLGPVQAFVKVATTDTALISDLAPNATSLEGYLFPNTYYFTRTQSMHDMAAEMVKEFRLRANELGLIQLSSTQLSSTQPGPGQNEKPDIAAIVNLASIIEKETSVPEERNEVAGVYSNRLASHIPLQADPSVIYAELLQGTYTGALHHEDMQFLSAYNTYRHAGLPPGPIANPGKSSLQAAMHPAQTSDYYFVSDGKGHHRFAATLEEHNRNVAALRRVMQQR